MCNCRCIYGRLVLLDLPRSHVLHKDHGSSARLNQCSESGRRCQVLKRNETGEDSMKYRAPAYVGVVLGVVALASSFAEPMALANGSSGPTATITVNCQGPGALWVGYTYSGFSGAVRGVDFVVGIVGETVDA